MEENDIAQAPAEPEPEPDAKTRPGRRRAIIAAVAVVTVAAVCAVGYGVWRAHENRLDEQARTDCSQAAKTLDTSRATWERLLKDAKTGAGTIQANQVKDAKTLDALKTALDVEAPEYEGCVADGKDGLETAIDELDDAAAWYEKHAGSLKKAVDAVNDSKLAKTIDTAKTLLESSNGNVQDDKTREELSKAIEAKDEAAIAKASKAVNDSIAAKQKADEEAKAKAQAEADAKAAAAANAQTQQQQYNYQQSQPQQSWTPSYPYGGGSTGGGSGTTSGGSGPAAASAPKPNLNGAYGCGNSCTGKDDGYYHH